MIMKHFKFLQTVTGKGIFNIFLASMFLIGNGGSIWAWLMFGAFLGFGVFFTLVGLACVQGYGESDKEIKNKQKGTTAGEQTVGREDSLITDESRMLDQLT